MSSRRDNLDSVQIETLVSDRPNASLLLDKYLKDQDKHKDQNKRDNLVKFVAELPVPAVYTQFYDRWVAALTKYGAEKRIARVKGRMIVGLGDESVLETSVTLHRTYGMPYIPGSALKGLAASYVHHYLGQDEAWKREREAHKVIFGNTEDAGFITFFDALYIPDSGHLKQPLYPDTITVHHPDYYQKKGQAPADWDSPTPIPFLSATGSYLVALAAPDLQEPAQWIRATFDILEAALKTMGIGAKTSSGYGRMALEKPPVDPDVQKSGGVYS
jgi:CRISPR-associated protein Cmr6